MVKDIKISSADHAWLFKRKVDQGKKSIGDVVHDLIEEKKAQEAKMDA